MTTKPLRTEHWPLGQFKPDPKELARHNDPEKVRQLGESMLARGQLQEVAATEDGRMPFGHGRWLAAKAVGIKTLEVKIYPASLTDTEFRLIRAAENLQRNELTGYQKWLLCADLMCGNPNWLQKDLAAALNVSEKMVTVNLSPSKCIPAVQDALKDGKIGNSDCYAISKLGEQEQAGLLALKLSGASRDQIEQAGRNRRNGKPDSEPPQRTAKIKIQLAINTKEISVNGMATVAALPGKEISLQEAENMLTQAAKAVREAIKQGLDAKTLERVCRDKAKRGGA
jgi:ParB-like chromosome segregation protein Spo0J